MTFVKYLPVTLETNKQKKTTFQLKNVIHWQMRSNLIGKIQFFSLLLLTCKITDIHFMTMDHLLLPLCMACFAGGCQENDKSYSVLVILAG